MSHIERKTKLKRHRQRRAKVKKLKARMAKAKSPHEAQQIQQKITLISPFWVPPGTPPPAKKPAPARGERPARK